MNQSIVADDFRSTLPEKDLPKGIPDIDYSTHPAYGALFGKPALVDRIRALCVVAPALARFTVLELRQAARRLLSPNPVKCTNTTFLERGICIERFEPEAKNALLEALAEPCKFLNDRLAKIPPAARSYEDAQLLVDRSRAPRAYEILERELQRLGVFELARSYLKGAKGAVKYFVLQTNDAGESHWRERFKDIGLRDSPANYLHVDTGVGVLKTIMYLSDVGRQNGPFCYAPGSHGMRRGVVDRIVRSAADVSLIGAPEPENRKSFSALPQFLQRKADFGKDMHEIGPDAEQFLASEIVATSNLGDVLIFDNLGAHRGGMVEEGRRTILQVLIH
jgi:hypothetical protein